jgi:hypothetical protein
MNTYFIKETCYCGSSYETEVEDSVSQSRHEAQQEVKLWREQHKCLGRRKYETPQTDPVEEASKADLREQQEKNYAAKRYAFEGGDYSTVDTEHGIHDLQNRACHGEQKHESHEWTEIGHSEPYWCTGRDTYGKVI